MQYRPQYTYNLSTIDYYIFFLVLTITCTVAIYTDCISIPSIIYYSIIILFPILYYYINIAFHYPNILLLYFLNIFILLLYYYFENN